MSSQAKRDFNSARSPCQARQSLTRETRFPLSALPKKIPDFGGRNSRSLSINCKEKRLVKALYLTGIFNRRISGEWAL
jgi:predicted transcriptional regulator YheO